MKSTRLISPASLSIALFALMLVFGLPKISNAQDIRPDFDPNYIISDSEIFNSNAMSAADIQNFLESKGSYLAAYTVTNPNSGVCETAAQAIYEVCQTNKISPRFVLVLLQKEQGLVEDPHPSQSSLDLLDLLGLMSAAWPSTVVCSAEGPVYLFVGFFFGYV